MHVTPLRPRSALDPELAGVLAGLREDPPRVSPRWLYDAVGSALFEAITRLPEYYPTRCELELLDAHAATIARVLPADLAVVELGSGSARKVGRLLPELRAPRSYHPVDVSPAALEATATDLAGILPDLPVEGACADFTRPGTMGGLLPELAAHGPVLLFFPGSTIGNFELDDAVALLAELARWVPAGTPFLLGLDLVKPAPLLQRAYDDTVGVTAAFNRNLLAHLNRRFGADFAPERWRHEARWVPERHRVELWLRSDGEQAVRLGDEHLVFEDGAGIHTESCHKWDTERLDALAHASGWEVGRTWTDARGWFAEALLMRSSGRG